MYKLAFSLQNTGISGIVLPKAFGIANAHLQENMKLLCWASIPFEQKVKQAERDSGGN